MKIRQVCWRLNVLRVNLLIGKLRMPLNLPCQDFSPFISQVPVEGGTSTNSHKSA